MVNFFKKPELYMKPKNSKRAHFKAPARKKKLWRRREKKSAKFWVPPPGPHFFEVWGLHPLGLPPFWTPPFRAPFPSDPTFALGHPSAPFGAPFETPFEGPTLCRPRIQNPKLAEMRVKSRYHPTVMFKFEKIRCD